MIIRNVCKRLLVSVGRAVYGDKVKFFKVELAVKLRFGAVDDCLPQRLTVII
jgi:hypothetical protein